MKARIFTTAVLMIVALATYAQTSRRGEREREKSTRTEENKNNDNKQSTRTESRRSERKVDNKSDNSQSADYQQSQKSRRENSGNNESNNRDQKSRESNRGNQNDAYKPVTNTDNSGNNQNTNDNKYRPVGNQGNNSYKPGESRRSEPDNKVVVTTPPKREYVRIEHNRRKTVVVNHPRNYRPVSVQIRREYHPYRVPVRREIVWSIEFRNHFRVYYPEVRYWRYEVGYRIPAIPAYDAYDYVGDVARIYGKAYEVFYEYETDEYYLYFGDYYPYHDFSVIVPGHEARKISRRPERLFRRSHIEVTGYITEFDNKPEMIIRNARQIEVY